MSVALIGIYPADMLYMPELDSALLACKQNVVVSSDRQHDTGVLGETCGILHSPVQASLGFTGFLLARPKK